MDNQKERIADLMAQLKTSRQKLEMDEAIPIPECKGIIEKLKGIKTMAEIESKNYEEQPVSGSIDTIIADFNETAEEASKLLQEMLSTISEGRVPEQKSVDTLDESIGWLQKKYSSIYQLVSDQIPDSEVPEFGSPVQAYVKAVEDSKTLYFKKILSKARNTLESFVSVRSLIAAYSAALEPYQVKAREILRQIISGEGIDEETLNRETAGPAVFLEALKCKDFDTEDSIELLDSLEEYYPSRVQNGVAGNKYYVDEAENVDQDNAEEKKEEKTGDEADVQGLENNGSSVLGTESESNITVSPEDDNANISEEHAEQSEPEKEDSEFVMALYEHGALIKSAKEFGILSSEINSSETKKITTSVFTGDMRKGNERAEKVIIKQIIRTNCLSLKFLIDVSDMPEMIAENTLNQLLRRGYLRKYSLIPGGSFYCASPRLMKALTFKDGSKFVGVKQRSLEDWGESIEEKASSAASRIAYTEIYTDTVRSILEQGITSYTEQSTLSYDAFVLRFFHQDEEYVLAFGAFWTNTEECDDFLETIENYILRCENIPRLIIAGLNLEYAKAVTESIFDGLEGEITYSDLYLYSLSDNKYYTYNDYVETPVEKIWLTTSDDIEEIDVEDDVEDDVKDDVVDVSEEAGSIFESDIGESSESVEKTTNSEKTVPTNNEVVKEEFTNDNETPPTLELDEGMKTSKAVNNTAAKNTITAEEEKLKTVYSMLCDKNFYAATAYAKAAEFTSAEGQRLYRLLSYALNDPMAHCTYSTDNVYEMISQRTPFEDAMIVSTAIRMFFSDQIRYDYNIKPFYNAVKDYPLLNQCPRLSKVVYALMEFKDKQNKGADGYAGYRAKSQAQLDKEILKIRSEASDFYNNFVAGRKKENASQKRFLETKKLMFSDKSDIGMYIKSIVDGDREIVSLIVEFLQSNFMKEDSTLSEDSISSDKMWQYIVSFWETAGENMMYRRHADLMSHLRSNITSTTTKAVQLLIKWCDLVERFNDHAEDAGILAYRKIKKPLIDNLLGAIEEVDMISDPSLIQEDEAAAYTVLRHTLSDILRCVDGSYDEMERTYFYVPFLLTDDIILDETYIPDLDTHSATVYSLLPTTRIVEHIKKVKRDSSFEDRLKDILNEHGDDYGSAKLILDYLKNTGYESKLEDFEEAVTSGVNYAKETADLRKEDFIGELELAQSYGQIDNSTEDKKEKILHIVDEWYEWAVKTSNYGFFMKVMDGYLLEIKESAKTREADLLEQLSVFQETQIPNLSMESKKARVVKIRKMIEEQNYTVAEDLLARAQVAEEEHEEVIDEDFLKDFLDNYDDYYQPVATRQANFASLVSKRTRNKEQRGAKRMADNWLPGGSTLGKERLEILLSSFGFKINTIKPQPPVVRYENYIVITAAAKGGRGDTFTHPISAFGSGASQDGFRVVCLNGGYDADSLIDVMKQIGNAKHTLILHDYALSKSERRRLARKTKNALGDKFFGVIDRTVMMFLVRNFDEIKINRMLISLITPFGYYQPYVWESVNVMPPEIFMGRKHELEKIKSPTGVNIVYGGRQLGKSALLKKAKDDVDWNENGDRAVYIDIKGLNYEEAAQKIGHELYDQFVLDEDIDTKDWNELSRTIRRRLQTKDKKIPYLLLLLDEADAFIESSEHVNYKPLDALKDIQNIGANRFKFVVAGLRNIVRFKREAALGNNSVLTHLQPMTVKPFNTSEARELMEIPLHYLGLRFSKEKEYLITLILATTNYFPGLIQMYCAKLLDAMRNKDYAGYDEVDTPIYEVSEDHIKRVLADPEFTQQIREKYIITLKLDEDNYYYLIALIMAYLYHNNGYSEGYSAQDISTAGNDLEISKISDLDIIKLQAFMEELRELNVLRSTDDTHYLFTRFTFFQMMGTSSEVEDKLVEYMGV